MQVSDIMSIEGGRRACRALSTSAERQRVRLEEDRRLDRIAKAVGVADADALHRLVGVAQRDAQKIVADVPLTYEEFPTDDTPGDLFYRFLVASLLSQDND